MMGLRRIHEIGLRVVYLPLALAPKRDDKGGLTRPG